MHFQRVRTSIIGYLMKLSIEQALRQGVVAHNSGNPGEAWRLYQTVLQSQPKHPDANHNLGLIAMSGNQKRRHCRYLKRLWM